MASSFPARSVRQLSHNGGSGSNKTEGMVAPKLPSAYKRRRVKRRRLLGPTSTTVTATPAPAAPTAATTTTATTSTTTTTTTAASGGAGGGAGAADSTTTTTAASDGAGGGPGAADTSTTQDSASNSTTTTTTTATTTTVSRLIVPQRLLSYASATPRRCHVADHLIAAFPHTRAAQADKPAVVCVRWSKPHGQLLASAGMDGCVQLARVPPVWHASAGTPSPEVVCRLSCTGKGGTVAALHDMAWSGDSRQVLAGDMAGVAALYDVETGTTLSTFQHTAAVTALAWHPQQPSVFLAGGARAGAVCWDVRTHTKVAEYQANAGRVEALMFLPDARRFVASSAVTRAREMDNGLVVWDFETGSVLKDQLYLEMYTCPALRLHPSQSTFMAQSQAGYIALFSAKHPYKLNRYKRLQGHAVGGWHIGFDVTPCGTLVASGASDGNVHWYGYKSGAAIKGSAAKGGARHKAACSDVACHPVLPSVAASCGWDGQVCVLGRERRR